MVTSRRMKGRWRSRCTMHGRAWLWQYSHPRGNVVFDFRLDRSRDGPRGFLEGFEGILRSNGYAPYQGVGGPQVVEPACWAHVRRKFFEAARLNAEDPCRPVWWRALTSCLG